MNKTVSWICISLGILAIFAAGYWCLFALAFGGSVLQGQRGLRFLALLLMGPLAVLPAGILGRSQPRWAGGWLIGGAFAAAIWHLGFVLHDGFGQFFRSDPRFEAWVPVTVICLPMTILGLAFIWSASKQEHAAPVHTRVRWPHLYIIATLLVAGTSGPDFKDLFVSHRWTVSVTPAGGSTTIIRLDDRKFSVGGELAVPFQIFFKYPGHDVDRKALGSYELKGPRGFRESYDCIVERRPNGLFILRNGAEFCWDSDDGLPLTRGTGEVASEIEKIWELQRNQRGP
jgi:hypothetical protein